MSCQFSNLHPNRRCCSVLIIQSFHLIYESNNTINQALWSQDHLIRSQCYIKMQSCLGDTVPVYSYNSNSPLRTNIDLTFKSPSQDPLLQFPPDFSASSSTLKCSRRLFISRSCSPGTLLFCQTSSLYSVFHCVCLTSVKDFQFASTATHTCSV